ncbi:MAG: extracellular solute-binding protein [Chloroflexi bacterium]|nr:extracellular solute-binding protein [Chloroflexota bacterium]
MKKFSVLILIALVLTVAVVPSSAQDGGTVEIPGLVFPDQIAEGRQVTITVDRMPAESDPEKLEMYSAQLERFQELYPNVEVEGLAYAYTPESFPPLVAAGNVPTITTVYFTEPVLMKSFGVPEDLTPFFDEYGLEGVYADYALDIVTIDDEIIGMPGLVYTIGIVFNIDMLDDYDYYDPPQTWDELAEMAQVMTDRENGQFGFSFVTAGGRESGWHFTNIAYGFGATPDDLVRQNEDGTFTATFGEGVAVEAMQYIHDLRWEYDVLPYDSYGLESMEEGMATGRIAMIMHGGGSIGSLYNQYPDIDMEAFGFTAVPEGPEGRRSLIGGDFAMIDSAATDDEKEAAFVYNMWRRLAPGEVVSGIQLYNNELGLPDLPFLASEYWDQVLVASEPLVELPSDNYFWWFDILDYNELTLVPEPYSLIAQDYYATLGDVVTIVLTDEDVDVAALMKEAESNFQTGILDPMQ